MDLSDRKTELLRGLHYTSSLPVRYFHKGELLYSIPDDIITAASVCNYSPFQLVASEENEGLQYVRTDAFENYILLYLPGKDLIVVGPFLSESVPEHVITRLFRDNKLNFKYKNELVAYYDSLEQINEEKHYYCGKLLESLFKGAIPEDPGETELKQEGDLLENNYHSQTNNYRLQLFSHSPYAVEQEICRTISNGDTLRAKSILGEINRRPRAKLAGTALRSLKNSIICSCTFMARAAISGGVSPDDAFTLSDTYIQSIERCSELEALLKFEEKMISGYTAAVNSVKKTKYSNAVNQTLNYIDVHLCEPLCVSTVAGAVFLNPNYLSGLFSKETGETIHDYIIRRRVEESAFFVSNGNESLADIAAFYQFSSQSHFVQSFKKIMGVTPGSFRRGTGASTNRESRSLDTPKNK